MTAAMTARAGAIFAAVAVLALGAVSPARTAGPSAHDRRQAMVSGQIAARGITDPGVLAAMRAVPRHLFVPEAQRAHAYEDRALPVGEGQTISQPYIVALMTQLARIEAGAKVLEVGTGSGYQAAILARMQAQVYTVEIVPALADRARRTLDAQGYRNIAYRVGDGYRGWPEAAPFAAILVTAAPDHVPEPLVDQLAATGRLVIPVGSGSAAQRLAVITRSAEGTRRQDVIPVQFVPMTGEAERRSR